MEAASRAQKSVGTSIQGKKVAAHLAPPAPGAATTQVLQETADFPLHGRVGTATASEHRPRPSLRPECHIGLCEHPGGLGETAQRSACVRVDRDERSSRDPQGLAAQWPHRTVTAPSPRQKPPIELFVLMKQDASSGLRLHGGRQGLASYPCDGEAAQHREKRIGECHG